MPIWLIEILGARSLDNTFLIIALMTVPAWLAMIVFPKAKIVLQLAHPLVLPPIYSVVLLVLLWEFYQSSFLPKQVDEVSYDAAKDIVRHPAAFLALFCNFQVINLALGTMIFQKAKRCGIRAPFELLLCGLLGAPALIPFVIRLKMQKKSLA
jgi:hypothetical protein